MSTHLIFGSEEVRQFVYCPRILYFRRVLRYKPIYPVKVSKGTNYHSQWSKKQERDITARSTEITKIQNLYVENTKLGLCTIIDQLEFLEYDHLPENWQQNSSIIELNEKKTKFCRITELKNCKAFPNIQEHHKAQLIAQALTLEGQQGYYVIQGRVRYRYKEEHVIPIWPGDKQWIKNLVNQMQQTILNELPPLPTPHVGKCEDCEYWTVCLRA